jgi:hypothetical protein
VVSVRAVPGVGIVPQSHSGTNTVLVTMEAPSEPHAVEAAPARGRAAVGASHGPSPGFPLVQVGCGRRARRALTLTEAPAETVTSQPRRPSRRPQHCYTASGYTGRAHCQWHWQAHDKGRPRPLAELALIHHTSTSCALLSFVFSFFLARDVVLVLDVSGSMSGPKIALVRESVVRMLGLLSPRDQVSIVTFNTTAQRHTPLLRVHGDGLAELVSKVCMLPRPRLHDGVTVGAWRVPVGARKRA